MSNVHYSFNGELGGLGVGFSSVGDRTGFLLPARRRSQISHCDLEFGCLVKFFAKKKNDIKMQPH